MASDSRRGGGFGGRSGRNGDRGGGRGGRGGRFNSSERDRDRSPNRDDRIRDPYMEPYRGGGGPRMPPYPPGGQGKDLINSDRDRDRDRSPIRDDRIRDPYMEPYRGGGSGGGSRLPPYPPGGDFVPRDPYYPDPYRRGPPEPWFGDDPYRRDPYADPYREPYKMRPPPLPIECEIFVLNGQLRGYGEIVERKIKEHNIITAVSIMPEGRTPQQLVDDVSTQNALFAVFINPQNEIHRSLTLNILHGTPQVTDCANPFIPTGGLRL